MSKQKGKFIVLTGIDASGKDFIARHLHDQDQGSTLIKTPTNMFMPIRCSIDQITLNNPASHYFFYLASVIHASQIISEKLEVGNVYCVRYLLDTVAYHRAMGLTVKLNYETEIYNLLKPDLTIFLQVPDESLRQSRLHSRNEMTAGDLLTLDNDFRGKLVNEYSRLSATFVTVNNADRDVQNVLSEIQHHIQQI